MQMATSAEPKCKTTVWIFQRLGGASESWISKIHRSLPQGELLGALRFLTPQIKMSGVDLPLRSLALFTVLFKAQGTSHVHH